MLDILVRSSSNQNNQEIWWAPLPHCPEGQLSKPGHPTDAGWDIKLAEDVLVEDYSQLAYEWEDWEPADSKCLAPLVSTIWGGSKYDYGDLQFKVESGTTFVRRKKYKPILAKTGILVNPQFVCWTGVHLRSSAPKFGVALANNLGVIDHLYSNEIFIQLTLQPGAGTTYLKRGERIAQLIPSYQFSNLELVQKDVSEMRDSSVRGGLGSTGTK